MPLWTLYGNGLGFSKPRKTQVVPASQIPPPVRVTKKHIRQPSPEELLEAYPIPLGDYPKPPPIYFTPRGYAIERISSRRTI